MFRLVISFLVILASIHAAWAEGARHVLKG
jgi:hypothetical protein